MIGIAIRIRRSIWRRRNKNKESNKRNKNNINNMGKNKVKTLRNTLATEQPKTVNTDKESEKMRGQLKGRGREGGKDKRSRGRKEKREGGANFRESSTNNAYPHKTNSLC